MTYDYKASNIFIRKLTLFFCDTHFFIYNCIFFYCDFLLRVMCNCAIYTD